MTPAPTPHDDDARLRALYELLILDTPPEERYDRIVGFAAAEFDMPIALISLVDRERQWFKARVGLGLCETRRDISFCGHAVYQRATLVVEDAALDARFADNPLVTGAPHVRFYAGAPLELADGTILGTLCLIDTRPRRLDSVDLAILGALRDLAVGELSGTPQAAPVETHGEVPAT
jgi:GAF domain-containing protein